jgi:hypothetical protein
MLTFNVFHAAQSEIRADLTAQADGDHKTARIVVDALAKAHGIPHRIRRDDPARLASKSRPEAAFLLPSTIS